jgi:hypothetical protein
VLNAVTEAGGLLPPAFGSSVATTVPVLAFALGLLALISMAGTLIWSRSQRLSLRELLRLYGNAALRSPYTPTPPVTRNLTIAYVDPIEITVAINAAVPQDRSAGRALSIFERVVAATCNLEFWEEYGEEMSADFRDKCSEPHSWFWLWAATEIARSAIACAFAGRPMSEKGKTPAASATPVTRTNIVQSSTPGWLIVETVEDGQPPRYEIVGQGQRRAWGLKNRASAERWLGRLGRQINPRN